MLPLVADRFTAALGLPRRSGISIPLPTPRSPPLNDDEGVTDALSLAPALALVRGVTIENDLDLGCAEDEGEYRDVPPSETGESSRIVLPKNDDAGLRETGVGFKLPGLGSNFLDRGGMDAEVSSIGRTGLAGKDSHQIPVEVEQVEVNPVEVQSLWIGKRGLSEGVDVSVWKGRVPWVHTMFRQLRTGCKGVTRRCMTRDVHEPESRDTIETRGAK